MNNESGKRWWLALGGKSEGPYTRDDIAGRLRSGQVTAATPACLEGAADWKPLSSWPDLAMAFSPASASAAPPPPIPPPFPNAAQGPAAGAGASQPVLTNPLLPQMANWICIYSIGVAPVIWFFQYMLCCIDGTFSSDSDLAALGALFQAVDALKSLAVTVLLVIGGMRLRRLRASGSFLIRIALWIGLLGGAVLYAIGLFGGVALAMSAGEGEIAASAPPENPAETLVQGAHLVVGFCELLFMIAALVWLTRRQRELPLVPGV